MGASSQRRENPFRMYGLVAGLSLQLELTIGGEPEECVTKVEEVAADRLAVLVPIVNRRPRPMRTGSLVRASYIHKRRRFRFVTEVVGHSGDGQLDYLSLPGAIDDSERRSHYRLETALRPSSIYRLVIDTSTAPEDAGVDATVVDLSEGGCCLASREPLAVGQRYGMQLDLPGAGEITVRFRVTEVDARRPGYLNYRMHCLFTDIQLANRDRIARYLMRRQLEMRRRGQL